MAIRYDAIMLAGHSKNHSVWSIRRNEQHIGVSVRGENVAHLALRVARALNKEASRAPRRRPTRPSLASGQLHVARRVLVRDMRRWLMVV